jgi:carbon storage regulator CsrA
MLVLARRLHEKIVLPTLDVSIQVVALQSNLVRLGFEAPQDVTIFREEVYVGQAARSDGELEPGTETLLGHNIRNRLNNLGLALSLLRHQLPSGLGPDAQKTLDQLQANFAAVKSQVQALLEEKKTQSREAQLAS